MKSQQMITLPPLPSHLWPLNSIVHDLRHFPLQRLHLNNSAGHRRRLVSLRIGLLQGLPAKNIRSKPPHGESLQV